MKVQYPGVGKALRSDLRQARLLARVMARLTRLNVSGLADELAARIVEELDYVREGRVQTEVAAAFTRRVPEAIAAARAAGYTTAGRTRVTVPPVYAATPRVLITGWLEGTSLSTLLDGRTDLLPPAGASSTVATQRTWLPGCSGMPSTRPRHAPAGCMPTSTRATSCCSRAATAPKSSMPSRPPGSSTKLPGWRSACIQPVHAAGA